MFCVNTCADRILNCVDRHIGRSRYSLVYSRLRLKKSQTRLSDALWPMQTNMSFF